MITAFFNLQASGAGGVKSVSALAVADGAGSTETVTFLIIDQTHTVPVNIVANGSQVVTLAHTANGQGLVKVSSTRASLELILDVGDAVVGAPRI